MHKRIIGNLLMMWIIGVVAFLGGAFSMAVLITCLDAYRIGGNDDRADIEARLRGDL